MHKGLYEEVVEILRENKEARDDGNKLLAKYIEIHHPEASTMTVLEFLNLASIEGVPSLESITRCRRKAQAQHLSLRATDSKRERRKSEMDNFIDWNRRHR